MSSGTATEAVPLADLAPTQYCLSIGKLRGVLESFDPDAPTVEPVSIARDADETFLLDGHTRAVCTLLAGESTIRAVDDTEDVDLGVYRTCRGWCIDRGVETIPDLVGELWSEERYEREWLARCHDAFDDA